MIEIQLDEDLYNKFKDMAAYSSDLTRVCSFHENMKETLETGGVILDNHELNKDKQAIITIRGNTMRVIHPTPEILNFLGNKREDDHDISVFYMDRVHQLILARVLEPDDRFKKFYSRIEETTPLSELLYGDRRLQGQNLTKITRELLEKDEDEEILMSDAPFKEENYRIKQVSYANDDVKFTSNIERNSSGRGYHIKAFSPESGRKYFITFYVRPTALQRLIMYNGGFARIAYTSARNSNNMVFVSAPEILPEGMSMKLVNAYSPIKRTPKVNVWRANFYEYKYRISLNAKDLPYGKVKLIEEGIFQ